MKKIIKTASQNMKKCQNFHYVLITSVIGFYSMIQMEKGKGFDAKKKDVDRAQWFFAKNAMFISVL